MTLGLSGKVPHCRAVSALLVIVSLMAMEACRRNPISGQSQTPKYPRYLEMVSLSQKQDTTRTRAISDDDGTTWYCEATAPLDLRDFAFKGAWVNHGEGYWQVVATVRNAASAAKLSAWTSELVGKEVGVICGGRLVNIATVRSPLSSSVVLGRFDTERDAEACAASLRAGGLPP